MENIILKVNNCSTMIYKIPVYGNSNHSRRIAEAKQNIVDLIKKVGYDKTKEILDKEGLKLYVACDFSKHKGVNDKGEHLEYYKGVGLIFTNRYIIENILSKRYKYAESTYKKDFASLFLDSLPKTVTGCLRK